MEFGTMMGLLLSGLQFTAIIFVITLVGALPLGVLVALGRMSKFKPLSLLVQFYISVMRGTPLMLQLMMWMFGPFYLFGASMGPDWKYFACCIGFILNYAAYFGEIYRSGIQSIPRGQYEAGQVLGMTKSQIFFKVTLLQVIKRVIPPMGNEFINLVKDTALARTIAVYEVLWAGEKFVKNPGIIWPLFYTAVFYLLFSGILTLLFGWIEKKMDYFK